MNNASYHLPLVGRPERKAFRVGGTTALVPHPKRVASLDASTSPQGGGELVRYV
jgi:hypothetical protein